MKRPLPEKLLAVVREYLPIMAICGLVAGACGVLYRREAGQIEQRVREREATRVGLQVHFFRSDLVPVTQHLWTLADGDDKAERCRGNTTAV